MISQPRIILIMSLFSTLMGHLLIKRHIDFRDRFMERKRERLYAEQRSDSNDIQLLNDVTHLNRKTIKPASRMWKKIQAIEKDFRRLLAMEGMKYNFKRDFYWRTWRKITSASGDKMYINYKCYNPITNDGKGSQNCGMWIIQERPPPCPYEIFSVINDKKVCGANYTQYDKIRNSCPSEIKFTDLTATCDNPIETLWRFTKMYGDPDKYQNIICEGKDYCEILTSYEISGDNVIFRIVNSTNDIIYSKIMKPNRNNYVCIEDCGRFNPNTRKFGKADKPLKLNLLLRKKREDVTNDIVPLPKEDLNELKKNTLLLSKNGGKLYEQKKKSKLTKKHQNNLDFPKSLIDLSIFSRFSALQTKTRGGKKIKTSRIKERI